MTGRYLISVDQVKRVREKIDKPDKVIIHDTDNLKEQCNTDQIGRKVRFNDLEWALGIGYSPCGHCMTSPDMFNANISITFSDSEVAVEGPSWPA